MKREIKFRCSGVSAVDHFNGGMIIFANGVEPDSMELAECMTLSEIIKSMGITIDEAMSAMYEVYGDYEVDNYAQNQGSM